MKDVVGVVSARGKFVMTLLAAAIDNGYAAQLVGAGVRMLRFSADVAVFMHACSVAVAVRDTAEAGATQAQ